MLKVYLIESKMKPFNLKLSICFMAATLLLTACENSSKNNSDNPYDSWNTTPRGPVSPDLKVDPNSIAGLQKNIFKPTCANSGCHDGNFEPDFRSIESTYNSLINRLATNYDPANPQINVRVKPGNAAESMILHRINTFIPGTQGQMPLTLDPGSDWTDKKDIYIQNIKNWINDGAKDQFGKSSLSNDFSPQLGGLIVFADGSSTPLPHSQYSPVEIPSGTSSIKIMVAYIDDKTAINSFGITSLNYSTNPYDYLNTEKTMTTESAPFNAKGILGDPIDYWHSITLSVASLAILPKDVLWLRTQTTDNVNPALYIPAHTAAFNTKKYFALHFN
jgi:hypothetical protein